MLDKSCAEERQIVAPTLSLSPMQQQQQQLKAEN
jgi:hypothetical protein